MKCPGKLFMAVFNMEHPRQVHRNLQGARQQKSPLQVQSAAEN